MGLVSDVKAARKVLRNAWRSRERRRQLTHRIQTEGTGEPAEVQIVVYFADTRVNLYQIRQWYAPLAELAKTHPVTILTRSPGATLTLKDEAPVPVVYYRTVGEIEGFLSRHDPRMVFYVNQNIKNFMMFRFGRMWHVFINHGESDKVYMTSNQYKSYDYAFVAGQAALDRLGAKLWDYDVARRAITIGRPQVDHLDPTTPFTPDDRITVFYAPTWEGDRPTMAYGSIASHGVAIADAVLASPRHRLVYRAHPRSGVNDREYREAHRRIVEMIAAANERDPSAGHLHDDGGVLGWQIVSSDVQITDISAMVYDRLSTGKPVIVTRPASPTAQVEETGFLGAATWLRAEDASDVLALIDRELEDPEARAKLAFWANHHFGDTTPGAATARFHAAVERLMAEWERAAAEHADDRRTSESDPFDDEDDEEAFPESGD